MKKLYYIFSLLLAMAFSACSPDMDEVFDKGASERAEEAMRNLKEVLVSNPNGWRMEYYGDINYGGYNVFCAFTNDSVTVASEKVGNTQPAGVDANGKLIRCTSHYTIDQSQGVILSFDEYNEIFHYFAEPKNADYGDSGEGFGGDFDFRVVSASADSIVMTGKKNQARIRMYPMSQSWEEYQKVVDETENFMSSRSYTLQVEGSSREINVTTNYRCLFFTYYDDEGNKQSIGAPYIVTEEGYNFYRPTKVDGIQITGVEKGATDEFFYLKDDHNARLLTYVPTYAESLETGMWFIKYEDLGAFAQPAWDAMRESLKTAGPGKTPSRLFWSLIGTYGNKIGFHMQAGQDYCFYGIKFAVSNAEGDEVKLTNYSTTANKAGKDFYSKYGMKDALAVFTNTTKGRTFKITADNQRKPSYLLLTDKDEPTNVIKLWANEVTFVYGELDNYDKQ